MLNNFLNCAVGKIIIKNFIAHNGLQLNADFVLHKICDLGAVIG